MTETAPRHRRVHAVSDLITGLNGLLEDRVGRIWVRGEISSLSRPSSGHLYFSLGDSDARIRAALFRQSASRVPFELKGLYFRIQVKLLGYCFYYALKLLECCLYYSLINQRNN